MHISIFDKVLIEERAKLNSLIDTFGLADERVIDQSELVDRLVLDYYNKDESVYLIRWQLVIYLTINVRKTIYYKTS